MTQTVRKPTLYCVVVVIAFWLASTLLPVSGAQAVKTKATLADLTWLSGHWTGVVDGGTIEQFCSRPMKGLILCMLRAMDEHTNAELEFKTLQQTPEGVAERVRFFSPDFEPVDPFEVRLVLRSYAPTEVTFENATGLRPKRETLTRTSAHEMIQRVELVDGQGKSSFIVAHYSKRAEVK